MGTIGTIDIGMRVNTNALAKGMKKSEALVQGFETKILSVKSALVGLGAGLAAGAIIHTLGSMLSAGSDLNEQTNKMGAVFGDNAKIVQNAADEMASRFGIVKTTFIDAASSIGLIGKASGMAGSESAKLGADFAKLAGDVSSFYNVPIEEALTSIRSGLVGEAEPMRKFGVLLNEAAVGAEAVRLGLAANAKALTEGMKVQARAALIARGLADAHGDLERTANGAANASRTLEGRVANLKADLGAGLQTVSESVLGGLNTAVVELSSNIMANQKSMAQFAQAAVLQGGIISAAIEHIGNAFGLVADVIHTGKLIILSLRPAILITGAIVLKAAAEMYGAFLHVVQGAYAAAKAIGIISPVAAGIIDSILPEARLFDDLTIASDQFAADAKKRLQEVQDALALDPPSVGIKKFFDDIRNGANLAATAAQDTARAVGQVGAVTSSVAGKIAELTKKLQEEFATFGMTSRGAELYKLAIAGASQAELGEVGSLSRRLDEMDAAKKAFETMQKDAKEYFESTRTPLEKLGAELQKIQGLAAGGMIDGTTATRAADSAQKEFAGSGPESQSPAALSLGSKEARTAILKSANGSGKEPIVDVAKNTADQVKLSQIQTVTLKSIAERLGQSLGNQVDQLFSLDRG